MKKLIPILLLAISLIIGIVYADPTFTLPIDSQNVITTDAYFYGAEYSVATSSLTWTAVDTTDGVLCGIWVIRASTSATGTVYVRATTTGTVVIPDIVITADANTGKDQYSAVDPVFVPPVPVRYSAGLKVLSGSANLDLLILYRAEISE